MVETEVPSRIRQMMHRAGLSMDELARSMGYARASSIQRYLTDGEYKKPFITVELARKLEGALLGRGTPPISSAEIMQLTGVDWPTEAAPRQTGLIKDDTQLTSLRVLGKVAANTWLDVTEMDFGYDDEEEIPAFSGIPREWQYVLIVDGKCLNKVANHGDKLVCLDLIKSGASAKPGDLVIVERRRFDGQMVERTAKRLRQSARGLELWPESHEPEHQDPIVLYEPNEDINMQIVAKVLWVMKKP
jgi:SOS-response transcriptional repressor LexA